MNKQTIKLINELIKYRIILGRYNPKEYDDFSRTLEDDIEKVNKELEEEEIENWTGGSGITPEEPKEEKKEYTGDIYLSPIIPRHKIKGLRFGQLLLNAVEKELNSRIDFSGLDASYKIETMINELFYIENKELQEIINKYLNEN